MRLFIGFDDTDILGSEFGTGKLVRRLEDKLPAGARMWGVIRHQLLRDARIPSTSHNSAACAVIEVSSGDLMEQVTSISVSHIESASLPGSDPGLCIGVEGRVRPEVVEFGLACTRIVETQQHARTIAATSSMHLTGHGGTNDGIIGALAAVGLTAHGWSGRLIERGRLRNLPDPVTVADLIAEEISPIDIGRDAISLTPETVIYTHGWPRPRWCNGHAVLPVRVDEAGRWTSLWQKRNKEHPCETS